jgi:two-component system sensor histidine kinase QseC
MKLSIRKFLLINLLGTLILTTTITEIGNFYLDQKDIQDHLDTLMVVSALSYQSLIKNLTNNNIPKIQQAMNDIPFKIHDYYANNILNNIGPKNYFNRFTFQLIDNNDKIILHSAGKYDLPILSKKTGFKDLDHQNNKWRIFSSYDEKEKVTTVLAENNAVRSELGHKIAQDDFFIMLFTFPISGVLIWFIVGRGLRGLSQVAKELANRQTNNLESVSLANMPTEILPLVEEINHLFKRLDEGIEREKRFTADAAHELKTPLAAIKTQAQVALNSVSVEQKNDALKKLIASVDRSSHVVQQLLTMSRLVPENSLLNDIRPVNLAKTAREIIAMLVPFAVEKNIEIEFEDRTKNTTFPGNETAIGILIRNLVDNAIRYSKNKGKILISVFVEKKYIFLEIQDNGPGISEKLQKRVFERFYRAIGTNTQGSGLGLAIVKQIVELHKGRISLSKPLATDDVNNPGLIVKVSFPI